MGNKFILSCFISNEENDDFSSNVYVYGLKNGPCIIIDAGICSKALKDYIHRFHQDDVRMILLTHAHFDHILALDRLVALYNCPIYLDKLDVSQLKDSYLNGSKSFGLNIVSHLDYQIINKPSDLKLDFLNIEAIRTPFHTLGSTCFYLKEDKILFSGDTVFANGGIGRYDLPHADASKIRESLNKILSLRDEVIIYPGHGDITSVKELKTYLVS